jgi:hypothetical protein
MIFKDPNDQQPYKGMGRTMLVLFLLCLAVGIWDEVKAAEDYPYLYTGEPRITQQWAYRIDASCPESFEEIIRNSMEKMEPYFDTRFLSTTNVSGTGDKRDETWLFWCDSEFPSAIMQPIDGVNHLVEEVKDESSNATLGRAHIYWQGSSIIEVDIQLDPGIAPDNLYKTLEHEIGHGSGCAHNTDNIMALMYPYQFVQEGWHVDDLMCLDYLYGPLPFAVLDYLGNLLLPSVRDMDGRKGWAVLKFFIVTEYGLDK